MDKVKQPQSVVDKMRRFFDLTKEKLDQMLGSLTFTHGYDDEETGLGLFIPKEAAWILGQVRKELDGVDPVEYERRLRPPLSEERKAELVAQKERGKAERQAKEDEKVALLMEAIKGNLVLYQCPGCDQVWQQADLVSVRLCPQDSCSTDAFNAEGGNNCPGCNRPFTRKICDLACEDCMEEDSEDLEPMNKWTLARLYEEAKGIVQPDPPSPL